jgi:hypothetical protein
MSSAALSEPLSILRSLSTPPAGEKSWRANKLPDGVTEELLQRFDDHGWIEFRVWGLEDLAPKPFENPDPARLAAKPISGWFSPRERPHECGDLNTVLHFGDSDPRTATEIRLSRKGRDRLDESERATIAATRYDRIVANLKNHWLSIVVIGLVVILTTLAGVLDAVSKIGDLFGIKHKESHVVASQPVSRPD